MSRKHSQKQAVRVLREADDGTEVWNKQKVTHVQLHDGNDITGRERSDQLGYAQLDNV